MVQNGKDIGNVGRGRKQNIQGHCLFFWVFGRKENLCSSWEGRNKPLGHILDLNLGSPSWGKKQQLIDNIVWESWLWTQWKDAIYSIRISAGKEFNVKFRATEELNLAWRAYQEKRIAGRTWWVLMEQVRVRGSIHSIHEWKGKYRKHWNFV